jgi:arylsulfatase A-like enzyme
LYIALCAENKAISQENGRKPNIVLILADDLGYGDLGSYGQTKILTPNLDRLTAAGVRFTQCYAGSTVCAPSRCTLMTGLHTGHCRVRGNGGSPKGNLPLQPGDTCVAEILKKAGYATALIGKWGLGEEGSVGVPNKKGFDYFYGYLNQTHAHNYYPDFLYRNEEKVPIPANVQLANHKGVAAKRAVYAPDLLLKEALGFVEANKNRRFFLYFSTTAPHANNERTRFEKNGNEVPADEWYSKEAWPQPEKDKAAMITRLDRDVGTLLAKLRELGLEKNTVVFFTSDNGPHKEGGNDPAFFHSSGLFRGIKRSLADGGIRMPMIVRWPGVVKPGTVSDLVWAFWDFLPTAAELAGTQPPSGLNGVTIVPTLTGKGVQKTHEFLYWEFHEGGSKQAVRYGKWKALKATPSAKLELYDVVADPHEDKNVAGQNVAVVAKIEEYLKTARTESKHWPLKEPGKKK